MLRRAVPFVVTTLLLAAAGCGRAPAPTAAPEERPNLVVYLIDTLRADHLGCYGYDRPTSPRIDAFAREAVRFAEARAQSSWTKPAVATILTGLHPVAHAAQRRAQGLDESVVTLAERLSAAGYATAYFGTNPTVTAKFGFAQGFDEFHYLTAPTGPKRRAGARRRGHVDADDLHREVVAWLERRDRPERPDRPDRNDPERPFFLVVHTLDPHDPYRPDERFRVRFAPEVDVEAACCIRARELAALSPEASLRRARQAIALYDAEIAQNDEAFGALLDELGRRGLLDASAVVLTSDHGEEFYEHGGWRHASTLYEEVLRVPFLLRLPGGEHGGRVLDGPLDQIDVAPTLLDLADLEAASELPGASWLPVLAGGPAPAAESLAWLEHPSFAMAAVALDGWKWTGFAGPPPAGRAAEELFDLGADPRELRNLAGDEDERAHRLQALVAARTARSRRAPAREVAIDPELDRTLRALGYL